MSQEKQVTNELVEKMSPEYVTEVLKTGYAGFSAAGVFVDRRQDPSALPVKKNSKLGIPQPAEVTPPSAQTPPEPPASSDIVPPPAQTPPEPPAPDESSTSTGKKPDRIDNPDKSSDSEAGKEDGNPPAARNRESKKPMTSFRFEFEILDGRRQIVDRQYVSVEANSEAEAIDQAVAKLQVKEGCTHRYTGNFSRKSVEA